MAALDTVLKFISRARTLLNDTIEPYRYSDADLIESLNEACLEAKRLRPDFFPRTFSLSMPFFTTTAEVTTGIPEEYRPAFVYYMVGSAQLRDEEDTQDERATILLNKFVAQLVSMPA